MKALHVFLGILLLIHHTALGRGARGRAQVPRSQPNASRALVIPLRINDAGEPYEDGQHFINYTSSEGASERKTARLYYRLTAFGKTFQFDLHLDHSFISPSLTVEHMFSETHRIPFAGDLLHCFYRGHINKDPVSSAVLNACDGLRGVFNTGGEKFFIEPMEPQAGHSNNDFRKFHLLYRHSAAEDRVSNGTLMCGLKETSRLSPLDPPPVVKHGRSRKRRALDEAFVETMVTADKTMSDAFKNKADLRSYITTLMGMVAQMYWDSSIGNRINIVLVKIIILEYEEPNLSVSSSATKSLKKFCKWQLKKNEKNDSHSDHYDTAILLTRTDICRTPGKCDTLGLAQLGTMCNSPRSCSIVEDTGMSTAFTIAHELGHIFGVPHDGDGNKCNRRSGKQRLMSPSLGFQAKPWSWSECSRDSITKFLDQGSSDCLRDPPGESISWQKSLPGELYSAEKQCQFVFGKSSSVCERMEECSRLWCTRLIGTRKACSTHHMPWADGTPCGKDKQKWCIKGKCVKKERLKAVDGQWSEWMPYGICTRTCGGGVAFAERECDNPAPLNGGLYCRGMRKRFRSCNTLACPESGPRFRDLQCRKLDEKVLMIKGVPTKLNWIPLYKVDKWKQCKLTCRAVGKSYYFTMDNVIDGTPCSEDTTDICVGGKCLPAGCDRILGSTAKFDQCGVCNGSNSTCAKSSGTFNKPVKWGYTHILTIPAGSKDVKITQYSSSNKADDNFLALKIQGGKYILNGAMLVLFGVRKFRVAGVKMWYSGSNALHEEIRMTGKTDQTLKVFVLSIGSLIPPNVRFSYLRPVKPKGPPYVWGNYTGKWTDCTLLCHGKRKHEAQCVRARDQQPVPNHRCDPRTKPFSIVEDCNTSCDLRWQVSPLEECSARCGPGKQTRRVMCMKVGRRQWDHVIDKHCKHMVKPPTAVDCEGMCTNSQWSYSKWTECSKSCGSGTQTRNATCYDNRGYILNDRDCRASDREPISRQCNTLECPGWSESGWTRCSVTCGEGVQTRTVKCLTDSREVPQSFCDAQTKPADVKRCVMDHCPTWQLGNWSECSVSCGEGVQTRTVKCVTGGAEEVPESVCETQTKPTDVKRCVLDDCPTWQHGKWSECSVTCGKGVKERIVYCDGEGCSEDTKPMEIDLCEQTACPEWTAGPWTECSVTCGEGGKSRTVKCVTDGSREVPQSFCDAQTKPTGVKRCELDDCPTWELGKWSQCSVSCGEGVQARTVKCVTSGSRDTQERFCEAKTKPTDVKRCVLDDCPTWQYGKWSECSVSCGDGRRIRQVQCVADEDGVVKLAPELCDSNARPTEAENCTMPNCPVDVLNDQAIRTRWTSAEWTECSVSCGEGVQTRIVNCESESGNRLKEEKCNRTTKPPSTQKCLKGSCTSWKYGSWGRCSRTCGVGYRSRVVKCAYDNWAITDDSNCDPHKKPAARIKCRIRPCETLTTTRRPTTVELPQWTTGEWNECSVSCGEGIKRRVVTCSLKDGTSSNLCDTRTKPAASTRCSERLCPKWTSGDWSECSVTCGKGVKERRVECDGEGCDEGTKPAEINPCEQRTCPKWRTNPWSECSVTCGQGVKRREVVCSGANCDERSRPSTTASCNEAACPTWTAGPWNKCTVTCGRGIQGRKVECDGVGCDQRTRPLGTRLCNEGACPQWRSGVWSECSKTCGQGEMKREVNCALNSGHKLDDTACEGQVKPQEIQACKRPECIIGAQWKKGSWQKCSVYCGEGLKRRDLWCEAQGKKIDDKYCGYIHKPRTTRPCNKRRRCGQWEMGPWSKCSKTCGYGVQSRAIRCLNGDEYKRPESKYCDPKTQPVKERPCNMVKCKHVLTRYQWQTAPWSRCSKRCGYGRKSRLMRCIDRLGNPVSEDKCNEKTRPAKFFRCFNMQCPPGWKHGDWSECSKTCGLGYQFRQVECDGVPAGNQSAASGCNRINKPPVWRPCVMGNCSGEHVWKIRAWSQCSVSCGTGYMRRAVDCLTKDGRIVGGNKCTSPVSPKPEDTKICHLKPCVPGSCKDVQRTNSLYDDGEHVLQIQGKPLQVYCHGMMKPTPREYITLKAGSVHNFAEVYAKRLRDPYTCPMDGSQSDTCNCEGKDYEKAGASYFSKLRIDLREMKILVDDKQFAETIGTFPPSYASAGDCYSARQCPQGRFGINLDGTGLVLSPSVKWTASGNSYSKVIYRHPEGRIVIGKCGGRCGMCRPDSEIGLKVVLS